MDNIELKHLIRLKLSQLDVFKSINEIQVAVRCPYCGDSVKNPNSAHFYIKLNIRNEDEPILFNCFRCDMSGIVTPSVLRTLGISDLQLNSSLIAYNSKTVGKINKALGITDNQFDFIVPMPDENDERNIRKKRYIEQRLGLEFTFKQLVELKTVFSLGQFLKANDIDKITTKREKAILLNNDYVGFLTTRNEFINFRNIYPNENKRYEKYSIFNNLDNTRKFYTIPNEIDLLTTKKITINIAEGVFDILGIYFHLYEQERKNMIYTAVCGSGFVSVLKYFIKMGVIDNVDINIYSDDNRYPKFYAPMVKELKPWVNEFTLFYNEKDKDYGVPKDGIKIVRKKI